MDAVELPSDGEGVPADRPTKSRVEGTKKNLKFDKKHKKLKDHVIQGQIDLVSPYLTPASKAVRGELWGLKREMSSMN
jgi:hypothetical protein